MNVRVNGKPEALVPGISVERLLATKSLDPSCVVVELNNDIIKKEQFGSVIIKEGDSVEILRFVGGG